MMALPCQKIDDICIMHSLGHNTKTSRTDGRTTMVKQYDAVHASGWRSAIKERVMNIAVVPL